MQVHFAIRAGLVEEALERLELVQVQLQVQAEVFHLSLEDKLDLLLRKGWLCIAKLQTAGIIVIASYSIGMNMDDVLEVLSKTLRAEAKFECFYCSACCFGNSESCV